MSRRLEVVTLENAAEHYAAEWLRPDRKGPSGKVFIGGVTQGAPEWGYINLNELEANGVERDRWFKPKPIGECDGEFAGYTPTATKGGA